MSLASRSAARPTTRAPSTRENRSGLTFDVARTLADVLAAWTLVHDSYVRARLIRVNAQHLHTVPLAVHSDTVVIIGREPEGEVVSTMSSYLDRPGGLPLDAVYADQLNGMRAQGRRLMEVGLFADRREKITRAMAALMELMRYTFFYAIHRDVSDIVIGVHPHHAGFYRRSLGFEDFADEAGCPSVNGNPMVPLRLNISQTYQGDDLPRGLAFFRANPLEVDAYRDRLELTPETVAGTAIDAFLRRGERSAGPAISGTSSA